MTWNELSQASLDEIMAWASDQPWCRAMADCQQDGGWHSEGNVWTHTQMVCTELPQLDEWPKLTSTRTDASSSSRPCFTTVAKPLTSEVDPGTGRITSPKHAIKSEHFARSVLRDLGCDLATREEIARLVRFHGRPAFLLERANPNHEVISLSWWVNNRLLYLFAMADTRGRRTAEMGRPEENLHFWKLAAEEAGCFEQPYPFANDHARFLVLPAAGAESPLCSSRGIPLHGDGDVGACLAAARILGWRQTVPAFPWSHLTIFGRNSTLKRSITRAKLFNWPENVAGNCSARGSRSHSVPRAYCVRPGSGGSTCLPTTLLASRSCTLSLLCPSSLPRTSGVNGRFPRTSFVNWPTSASRRLGPRPTILWFILFMFLIQTMNHQEVDNTGRLMSISIPNLSFVVLIGPSGSGKSTFARKHFLPTEVLSSDYCRGIVSDDENEQAVTNDAFEVLHFIARKRLALGRLTVVDATNVQPEARKPLIQLGREYHCLPVAIVFDLPERVCEQRNQGREDRDFGPHVIRQQRSQLRRSIRGLKREGFSHVFIFETPEEVEAAVIERTPLWNDKREEQGPFDIIGDLHGCCDELEALLQQLGYVPVQQADNPVWGNRILPASRRSEGGVPWRPCGPWPSNSRHLTACPKHGCQRFGPLRPRQPRYEVPAEAQGQGCARTARHGRIRGGTKCSARKYSRFVQP